MQKTLEKLLGNIHFDEKIALFDDLYSDFRAGRIDPPLLCAPKRFELPSYSGFCHSVVPLGGVKKRAPLTTYNGRVELLHSLAHIEYSAIDLALDSCYRFGGMPREFYDDWLKTAH
ncbi:MAG: ferritin-like domain-containing protein, partial [Helicobacteraceae bacterium]|nr:ferritin-like domain-containing protein [Helicobacteraceae bacterium]